MWRTCNNLIRLYIQGYSVTEYKLEAIRQTCLKDATDKIHILYVPIRMAVQRKISTLLTAHLLVHSSFRMDATFSEDETRRNDALLF